MKRGLYLTYFIGALVSLSWLHYFGFKTDFQSEIFATVVGPLLALALVLVGLYQASKKGKSVSNLAPCLGIAGEFLMLITFITALFFGEAAMIFFFPYMLGFLLLAISGLIVLVSYIKTFLPNK